MVARDRCNAVYIGRLNSLVVFQLQATDQVTSVTLAIAGVTGFIGRHLLRRCHDSSIDTVLLVRPSQVNSPFGHGVDVVDLSEATQLLRGRSAHEDSCLVHLIGASRDSAQASVWQSNVDTTRALIEIAEAAGLRRIVYLSGYGSPTIQVTSIFDRKRQRNDY